MKKSFGLGTTCFRCSLLSIFLQSPLMASSSRARQIIGCMLLGRRFCRAVVCPCPANQRADMVASPNSRACFDSGVNAQGFIEQTNLSIWPPFGVFLAVTLRSKQALRGCLALKPINTKVVLRSLPRALDMIRSRPALHIPLEVTIKTGVAIGSKQLLERGLQFSQIGGVTGRCSQRTTPAQSCGRYWDTCIDLGNRMAIGYRRKSRSAECAFSFMS